MTNNFDPRTERLKGHQDVYGLDDLCSLSLFHIFYLPPYLASTCAATIPIITTAI